MKFYPSIASLILVIAVNFANSFGLTARFGQTTLKTRVMEAVHHFHFFTILPILQSTAVAGGGGSIGDLTALSGMASLSMKHHGHRGGGRTGRGRVPLRHHSLNASTSGSEEREPSPDHSMAT